MTLFFTTFIGVFLLGWQQQNVTHLNYKLAALTSMCIALTQFLMFKAVMVSDYIGVLYMGVGGSMGITLSMYLHSRWRKGNVKNNKA